MFIIDEKAAPGSYANPYLDIITYPKIPECNPATVVTMALAPIADLDLSLP